MRPVRLRPRPRRIVVAALRASVGTTTTAALLGLALAADRRGQVGALNATPYAGGLASRLLSPPSSASGVDAAHRLTVREVDPQASTDAVAAAVGDVDVAVVDVGTDLAAAARPGMLEVGDQLVLVDSLDTSPTSPSTALDQFGLHHPRPARDAVIVLVSTDPSSVTDAPTVTIEQTRAVVRLAFDGHLASGGVVDLARVAGPTVEAVRVLAKLVSVAGSGDDAPPVLADRGTRTLEGLHVPALVVDGATPPTAALSATQDVPHPPTAAAPGGRGGRRPLLSVVVCAVVAVVAAVFLSGATGESGSGPVAAACGTANGRLPAHDGHPSGAAACVKTAFGAMSAQDKNPSLLIVDSPSTIKPGEDIELRVSIRNLVRDNFPASSHGGYYAEPAQLSANGLTRGHVHSACRVLGNPQEAPQPDRVTSFVAIEDDGGGAAPDTVEVHLPGRDVAGQVLFPAGSLVQCTTWAGDGSHRVPMDTYPNQVPAVDAVRITVAAP